MKSVLKELSTYFYLILNENGDELTKNIVLNDDINSAFEILMQTINKAYIKNINHNKKIRVFIKKTNKKTCFLKVTGRDHNTILIIRPNDYRHSEYVGITGYKVTESDLIKTIDLLQRDKLEKSGVAKRFIKEEIPDLDLYEEMQIEKLIQDCKTSYILKNSPKTIELFDEPENITGGTKRITRNKNVTPERLNPVIPYEMRKQELIKYNQKEIIRFQGTKTNNIFDAYIYIKHGYILAIVEPVSGLGYQYNLTLGYAEDYNEELITKLIKTALETEEHIVLTDDAIIRKNHTTIENFKDNIGIFLNNKDYNKLFALKTEKAKKVYQKTIKSV